MYVVAPDVVGSVAVVATQIDLIARERHAFAVDLTKHGHVVVGVSRGVEDLEFVLLPLEGLALGQGAFDLHGLGVGAPEFLTVRVSEDVGHVLVAPDARGVVFLQVGQVLEYPRSTAGRQESILGYKKYLHQSPALTAPAPFNW